MKIPVLVFSAFLAFSAFFSFKKIEKGEREREEIGPALEFAAMARLWPSGHFQTEKMTAAVEQMRLAAALRGGANGPDWAPLGPCNRAGRALCLAFHPTDPNVIWVGTASGGLWKTTSAGLGAEAWARVSTGFPTIGVSAIAVDPTDPQTIFLGTGEVYNFENSAPGVALRTTRGSYGIGILKTTDGGATWQKSLDWTAGDLRGVQDLKMNPLRSATLFAATTEGVLRSRDAGATWQNVFFGKMAVDLEIDPTDTSIVFVTVGSLDDEAQSGIFRSKNGGQTFEKLENGLPATFSGKAMIALDPQNPKRVFASVADAFQQQGLFFSENGGDSWSLFHAQNVAAYQGWFAHDVAVSPADGQLLMHVGVDAWRNLSPNSPVIPVSDWSAWPYNEVVPIGGPEGPEIFVHADIHRVYFHPSGGGQRIFMATDGGVFASEDGGNTFSGRNGGLQTMQFYHNFAVSQTNSAFALGGAQDNNTNVFEGTKAWRLGVIGGDGTSCAIRPDDDEVRYGASQYLNLVRFDGDFGLGNYIPPPATNPCFVGAFELAPSDPDVVFAGGAELFRSLDRGDSWEEISDGPVASDGGSIYQIAVCPTDPNLLFCSTAPISSGSPRVFKSTDGGQNFDEMTGLPDRICMDLAFAPNNPQTVFAVFSGFGASHVWRTADGGATWQPLDGTELPDVPTNCILIDPAKPAHLYVGNDAGLFFSPDGGQSWLPRNGQMPDATMVYSLAFSASDRKIKIATHGLGLFEAGLEFDPSLATQLVDNEPVMRVSPNPASGSATAFFELKETARCSLRLFSSDGRLVKTVFSSAEKKGKNAVPLDLEGLGAGVFAAVLEGRFSKNGRRVRAVRTFLVN